MRSTLMWPTSAAITVLTLFSAAVPADSDDHPPNVLLITADNLGYGDLPCFNPESQIKAPNLGRLAEQGARLTAFYTASPTCTVSRACLLTGRIPQRHGLTRQLPGVAGNYGVGLNQKERVLPQYLKSASVPYVTGCFGKWNIGFAKGSRPTERGFDEFIGHASGNMDYYHHNYREKHDLYDGLKELHQEGTYSTDLFADAAIDFMQRHSKQRKPWFCYLPFNAPHFPTKGNKQPGEPNIWQAPDSAFAACGLSPDEQSPEKRYRAVVFALDEAIGRVMDALKATGESNRTFVFFMSDNGAFRLGRDGLDVGSNHPLRKGGVTCWEGGLRVAAIARWPEKIAAGSVVDEPLWSPDILVTATKLAGVPQPADTILDGRDLLPTLCGEVKSPHRSLFFSYGNHAALRMGDWKIVRESSARPWQLFHLKEDPGEQVDRAPTHPEKLAGLIAEAVRWSAGF
jgi:arylsulfatase A